MNDPREMNDSGNKCRQKAQHFVEGVLILAMIVISFLIFFTLHATAYQVNVMIDGILGGK